MWAPNGLYVKYKLLLTCTVLTMAVDMDFETVHCTSMGNDNSATTNLCFRCCPSLSTESLL